MKILEIIGANHFDTWTKRRTACRGIVVQGDQILLSYITTEDQYVLPGGGLEGEESPEECCRRELAEETGTLVSVGEGYLTLREYYEEWCYETHFFVCAPIGETERTLTEKEGEMGLIPRWLPLEEALAVFSRHQDYAETDEEKRGIYLREYLALTEYAEKYNVN